MMAEPAAAHMHPPNKDDSPFVAYCSMLQNAAILKTRPMKMQAAYEFDALCWLDK